MMKITCDGGYEHFCAKHEKVNKLAKLGDAIAISKSEFINHSLTHPLTDRGNCQEMLLHLKRAVLEAKYENERGQTV